LDKIPCRLIDCDEVAPAFDAAVAFGADGADAVLVFTSVLTIELCSCMATSGDTPLNEIQDSHFDRRTVLELLSSGTKAYPLKPKNRIGLSTRRTSAALASYSRPP
jgi:hypothetical protein